MVEQKKATTTAQNWKCNYIHQAIADIAEAILMQIPAEQVPSIHRVAPRYLKLVTSFNFWLFMLISAPMLFMLLVMILLFFMLTSILYAINL